MNPVCLVAAGFFHSGLLSHLGRAATMLGGRCCLGVALADGIASVEVVAKMVLYYLHKRA